MREISEAVAAELRKDSIEVRQTYMVDNSNHVVDKLVDRIELQLGAERSRLDLKLALLPAKKEREKPTAAPAKKLRKKSVPWVPGTGKHLIATTYYTKKGLLRYSIRDPIIWEEQMHKLVAGDALAAHKALRDAFKDHEGKIKYITRNDAINRIEQRFANLFRTDTQEKLGHRAREAFRVLCDKANIFLVSSADGEEQYPY